MLTVKSDVYSFGIVLLEIITGLPPIVQQNCHILQHVRQKLQSKDITSVVDRRLEGDYDINSIWKVYDLAMKCTQKESAQRPTMSQVVAQLEESLDLEAYYVNRRNNTLDGNNSMRGNMHSDTVSTTYFTAPSTDDSVGHSVQSKNTSGRGG